MDIAVGRLTRDDVPDAIGVLARGMRDNPLSIAVFGEDPDHRLAGLARLFGRVPSMQPEPIRAGADDALVGYCGFGPPPECRTRAFASLAPDQFPPVSDDAAEQSRYIGVTNWFMRRAAK